jgi:hypothetical protein
MGWASAAIDRLRRGRAVTLRPRGRSMAGHVSDGDLVTGERLGERELRAGDIAPVRRHGREYLHLVNAIRVGRALIGNTRGGVNGRVGHQAIARQGARISGVVAARRARSTGSPPSSSGVESPRASARITAKASAEGRPRRSGTAHRGGMTTRPKSAAAPSRRSDSGRYANPAPCRSSAALASRSERPPPASPSNRRRPRSSRQATWPRVMAKRAQSSRWLWTAPSVSP